MEKNKHKNKMQANVTIVSFANDFNKCMVTMTEPTDCYLHEARFQPKLPQQISSAAFSIFHGDTFRILEQANQNTGNKNCVGMRQNGND